MSNFTRYLPVNHPSGHDSCGSHRVASSIISDSLSYLTPRREETSTTYKDGPAAREEARGDVLRAASGLKVPRPRPREASACGYAIDATGALRHNPVTPDGGGGTRKRDHNTARLTRSAPPTSSRGPGAAPSTGSPTPYHHGRGGRTSAPDPASLYLNRATSRRRTCRTARRASAP